MKEIIVTKYKRKNYVLNDKKDFTILSRIKKLNNEDKKTIKLTRTQLEKDWRTPLVIYLSKLIKKYEK